MNSPKDIAQKISELSYKYASAGEELTGIKQRKAFKILEIRMGVKSDTQAERIWQVTLDGLKEIELTYLMKGLEKIISAEKKKLEVMNHEVFNQY